MDRSVPQSEGLTLAIGGDASDDPTLEVADKAGSAPSCHDALWTVAVGNEG
jgi:hypothetical protein